MAVVTCIVWIVDKPCCEKCGTVLGHNVVVSVDRPSPQLLCRKCRWPCRIEQDGKGVPIPYYNGRRFGSELVTTPVTE